MTNGGFLDFLSTIWEAKNKKPKKYVLFIPCPFGCAFEASPASAEKRGDGSCLCSCTPKTQLIEWDGNHLSVSAPQACVTFHIAS